MGQMNLFTALFGIFRQRGLVQLLREDLPLRRFILSAIAVAGAGGALYGFAMGIGFGLDTAIKDATKVALIVLLALLLALPIFWLTYRLLGRADRAAHVTIVPITCVLSAALALAVASPIVFLLSILTGVSENAVYVHIVIVDAALLVGLYVAGTLVYHGFATDRARLVAPNAVSFVLIATAIVVLVLFFRPYLSASPTFSTGTDMLLDRLGIGVEAKARRALDAAAASEHMSYHYQALNASGDTEREYDIVRVGGSYSVTLSLHAVPGDPILRARHLWLLDGMGSHDFSDDRVSTVAATELTTLIAPALPDALFRLPVAFAAASWRGTETATDYTLIGTAPDGAQVTLTLDPSTQRLTGLLFGAAGRVVTAQTRVDRIRQSTQSRADIEVSLRRAIVVGNIDHTDATLTDYVQPDVFFAARIPYSWRIGLWNPQQRRITFTADCGIDIGCPDLTIATFDLIAGKDARAYANDLSAGLQRQPQYREVVVAPPSSDPRATLVEYLVDRPVKGRIETIHHREYIFVGERYRYHLDFSAPQAQFEASRALFETLARAFVYLQP